MSLIPFDPYGQIEKIRNDVDRIFASFPFNELVSQTFGHFQNTQANIQETEHEVIATFFIPGIEKTKDIHIHVDHRQLRIQGSIHQASEINANNNFTQQQYIRNFQQMIVLPCVVAKDGVKSTYNNSVLEVRMQKKRNRLEDYIDIDFN